MRKPPPLTPNDDKQHLGPDAPRNEPPVYAAPGLDKALDILELLSKERVPLTRAQMARMLGRTPGELFRILVALERRGYVRRETPASGYRLTLRLFELSRNHSPNEELLRCAIEPMRHLNTQLRESCHLSVLSGDEVLVLAQEASPKPFRASVEIGSLHPLARTTSGRVLLAGMTEADREACLARLRSTGGFDRIAERNLRKRLKKIAADKHDLTRGEWIRGALDIGVLVGSETTRTKAALVVTMLEEPARIEAVLEAMWICARSIEKNGGMVGLP